MASGQGGAAHHSLRMKEKPDASFRSTASTIKPFPGIVQKKFKRAMHFHDEVDQDEVDIDVVCPSMERIRSGMLEKKCGGTLGAELETWKPRFAVRIDSAEVLAGVCSPPVRLS